MLGGFSAEIQTAVSERYNVPAQLFDYHTKSRPSEIPTSLLSECVRISKACAGDALKQQDGEEVPEDQKAAQQLLFHCTVLIRKMLSVEEDPPIDEVIASDDITKFWVGTICQICLQDNGGKEIVKTTGNPFGDKKRVRVNSFHSPTLHEMSWALTNIASGQPEHTNHVLSINGAQAMMDLLRISSNDDVLEQAAWSIGNMGGDNAKSRDFILGLGASDALLELIQNRQDAPLGLVRNAIWAVANLARGKPVAALKDVTSMIPVFLSEINLRYDRQEGDDECAMDAMWGLSYIAEGGSDRIAEVLRCPLFSPSAFLCVVSTETRASFVTPAMRFLGSIATGSDTQARLFFHQDFISPIANLLSHPKRGLRKECAWCLSNLVAGPLSDLKFIMNSPSKVMQKLLSLCSDSAAEVRKEAVWAIANASSSADVECVTKLVQDDGFIEVFTNILTVQQAEFRLLAITLEGLSNVFQLASAESTRSDDASQLWYEVSLRFFDVDGLTILEELQGHNNTQVNNRASDVLEYFEDFDTSQPKGIDRKWAKSKSKKKEGSNEDSDDDHNSDGEGYDL